MKNDEVKERLISAAAELLQEAKNPEKVTTRQIAERAETNQAMVNYYFESKDQLLTFAVGRIIANSADHFKTVPDTTLPPRERLRKMLYELCEEVVQYERYTKIYVPYILLEDEISAPPYILPILREYFNGAKTELECKVIAYQMISFMQLIFFRSETFYKYSGSDLHDREVRKQMIDMQLNLFLGEEPAK